MPANLENSAVVTRLEKSVFISIPKKGNSKECSNYCTIALISYASSHAQNSPSQASAICESWTSKCSSWIRKGRGTRDQIANIRWIIEKARELQKNIYFCFLDYAKAFDCGSQQIVENSSSDGNTRPPDLPSWEICMQVKKQQLDLDMEQQTGSKLGKEYIKAVYCHPVYLSSM